MASSSPSPSPGAAVDVSPDDHPAPEHRDASSSETDPHHQVIIASHQKASGWQSAWCSLAQEEEDTTTVDVNEPTVVVPRDGWYSLFFGHAVPIYCAKATGGKKKKKRQRVAAHTAEAPPPPPPLLPVTAYLSIRCRPSGGSKPTTDAGTPLSATTTPQESNEGEAGVRRTVALPWREQAESMELTLPPQILDPPSFHLGRLLWLSEGNALTLVRSSSSSCCPVKEVTAASVLWKLRFHHTSQIPPVDLFHCKRPWVCNLCQKTFPTAHRVSQHQEVSHYQEILRGQAAATTSGEVRNGKDSSLMWTTPLSIAYNDDYLAVVIKPQGMAVMGHFDGPTLQRSSLLLALAPPGLLQKPKVAFTWPAQASKAEAVQDSYLGKPRPVHRLDAPTGGLLVVAKTHRMDSALKQVFADRHVHKTYWALVYGKIAADTGQCDQALSGKPSLTHYKVLKRTRSLTSKDGWLTTVELSPVTGRQHQLRRHMQLMGHGLWGDARYGPRMADKTAPLHSRLCLWALAIRFPHPVTGQDVSCRMDEPEWLQHVVQEEESIWQQAQEASAGATT
jgi:23S rRNA pseudouridine1911/1915/1917 synthase